jgi:uncharacterized protein YaeQ
VALSATIRRFAIALADADRGVFAELDLRVAQHPSESPRYLVARVLARALEHADGIEFGRGVSTDEEPAILRRDLRGDLLAWIEIGLPSCARLHRASKTGARVAVYGWRGLDDLAAEAAAEVFRAEALELVELPAAFLDAVAGTLERANRWELSVSGGTLYLAIAGAVHEGAARRVPCPARGMQRR